jgi:hypothetical protein
MNVYCTVPPGAASHASRPCTAGAAQVDVKVKPGNSIEVLPTAAGRPFSRFTVTESPSCTIIVGPGTCIVGQVWLGKVGAKPVGATLHP